MHIDSAKLGQAIAKEKLMMTFITHVVNYHICLTAIICELVVVHTPHGWCIIINHLLLYK